MQASDQPVAATPEAVAERLLEVWRRISGSASALYRALDEIELSLTQLKALEALLEHDQPPSVKRLAEQLDISLPQASRTIEVLCRRGYVDRREDTDDRRVKRLRPTPAGREVVLSMQAARLANLRAFADTLSPEALTRLAGALDAVLDEERR